MKTAAHNRPIGIGIVTFNNLPLIERCFPSWRACRRGQLVVFDNGSAPEVVAWLKRQRIERLILASTNRGVWFARNRILEYFRDRAEVEFVLLADSDVRFDEGMIEELEHRMRSDPRLGFVGYPQANKAFPVSPEGYVEEIAGECQLTRMEMWREIGLFPETLEYYSADSWKSTIANMHGWRTAVVEGRQGYHHFQHSSHVNPGVREAMQGDRVQWARKEAEFVRYWRHRILLGKGERERVEVALADSDASVREEEWDPGNGPTECLIPSCSGLPFTPQRDVEALIRLSQTVHGNLLEIGCHEGMTTLQLALRNPEKLVYALDYSGDAPTLCEAQRHEQPTAAQVGRWVRPLRNVRVFDERFDRFDLRSLHEVDFVFYDADLTYDGVKEASERILEYFLTHPVPRPRLLVWHDYAPQRNRATHPDWLRLGEYVRRQLAPRYPVTWLRDTALAFLRFPPDPGPTSRASPPTRTEAMNASDRVLFVATHGGMIEATLRHLPFFEALKLPLIFLSPEDEPAVIPGHPNYHHGQSSHADAKMIHRFAGFLEIMHREGAQTAIYAEYDQLFLQPLPEFNGAGIGCVRLPKYCYGNYREFQAEWFPIVPFFFPREVLARVTGALHRYLEPNCHEHGHLDRWLALLAQAEGIPLIQVPGAWTALHGYDFDNVRLSHRDAVREGAFVLHPIKSQQQLDWVEQHCAVRPYAP